MNSIGTIRLTTNTGLGYDFSIYPMNDVFTVIPAVYAFTYAYDNGSGGFYHDVLYVGQTENLAVRLYNHEKLPCAKARKANRICVLHVIGYDMRLQIEAGLVKHHQPACNELLKTF